MKKLALLFYLLLLPLQSFAAPAFSPSWDWQKFPSIQWQPRSLNSISQQVFRRPMYTSTCSGTTALDAAVENNAAGGWNHSVTTSSDCGKILIVCLSVTTTGTVTYGGVSMTQAISKYSGDSVTGSVQIFYLVNPPTGTNAIAIGGGGVSVGGSSLSFTFVDSASPIASSASGSSTSGGNTFSLTLTAGTGAYTIDAAITDTGTGGMCGWNGTRSYGAQSNKDYGGQYRTGTGSKLMNWDLTQCSHNFTNYAQAAITLTKAG